MENNSMENLMAEIREVTKKQKASSRVDEIKVMKTMLNDPNFSISVYDKNKGYIGTRCPREEAVKFAANLSSAITGLDTRSSMELAKEYEFSKRDAIFLIDNSRDFTQTYLSTGRKLPIIQSKTTEAALIIRPMEAKNKVMPSENGEKKVTRIAAFDKVICKSKSPKYNG